MTAALRLSGTTRRGTPSNDSKARRCSPSQVPIVWSKTNSAYWWRLNDRVITNTQALRRRPVRGSGSRPAAPKSTWASSPGPVCTRTTADGVAGRSRRTKRRSEE